ncbi:hypothetical protein FNV43_RR24629 [Rhamnella rubrinervis]|uniref:Laccase n=1 Tax=Rhamnella rubrinervis TaxID=2594499 RepID=A0A8K0GLE0_9ROSA|nr:hypothetical protein FNV43_RR24629 [Rhamnella rubrinervis]
MPPTRTRAHQLKAHDMRLQICQPARHGVRQFRTGWADGPAYLTQCPIQPGQNYVYNFTVSGQRGTLLWHHISWLRATLHGAIVILPKRGLPYPFPKPYKQKIIILAEWWKSDVEAAVNQATQSGLPPNVSDAHTINGLPGPVSGCFSQGFTLHVERWEFFLYSIINAAVNDELFFKIAGHNLTIVEADASYTKPFQTDIVFISPGQTTNALLKAEQGVGKYLITFSPFMDAPVGIDNLTNFATLRYKDTPTNPPTILSTVPAQNATIVTSTFGDSLRSLNSKNYPVQVPLTIDHSLLFAVGLGVNPCAGCVNGTKLVADINNVSFVLPTIALLQAHYYNIKGVYTDDFPGNPLFPFNYTGNNSLSNMQTTNGTRLYRLPYNSTVQIVLQGTAVIAPETHPTHLHGFNFYVVGRGLGNLDPKEDPKRFNLIDPVERNTVGVPTAGWVAIIFKADNPGA